MAPHLTQTRADGTAPRIVWTFLKTGGAAVGGDVVGGTRQAHRGEQPSRRCQGVGRSDAPHAHTRRFTTCFCFFFIKKFPPSGPGPGVPT